jgi:SAM-dependent methyltransferase
MDVHQQANRRRWDELAPLHARTAFYDVAGFKAGKCSLKPIEVGELGDVASRSLLHLQCHFGLDTLSWARRGALVTGVDYSEAAVAQARALAAEVGLAATFVCSRVEDLPDALTGTFDVVFTSYGVLCWLPDLRPWVRTITHFLKPGGTFYLVEMHPFADALEELVGTDGWRVVYPYFADGRAQADEVQGTYADRGAEVANKVSYVWSHHLGEILTALLDAGLRLEFVHEFPQCVFPRYPDMTRGDDGWWRLPPGRPGPPLLFSVKAHRPA